MSGGCQTPGSEGAEHEAKGRVRAVRVLGGCWDWGGGLGTWV